ncbi:chitobiase/beta-hexosaminidase C-terminal domain-containing protein [Treponema bryantii]|uniref:chitobiase/beta-hexosaminidase C-terminal domain-containing protein n=1 Tax=Treponema bryantii TaxID=163 RepID=UPI002B2B49F7|nr:hypothetical protein TRBR_27650 [Treponema bryantii]
MKRNFLLFLSFILCLFFFSCSNLNNDLNKPIKLKNLSFDKNPGLYTEAIEVSIKSVNGGTIYYTLDGSNPTKNSYIYNSPISLSKDDSSTTITAIEMKDGFENSELLIGTFKIKYEDITSIDFEIDDILYLGNEYNLSVNFYPRKNPNLAISYTSSNNGIVSIDDSGKVTPLKKGETFLQITLPDVNISYQKKIYVYEDVIINNMIQTENVTWGPYERIVLNTEKVQLNTNCILTINSNTYLEGTFTIQTWGRIFINEVATNIKIDTLYIRPQEGYCNGIQLYGLEGNKLHIEQAPAGITYTDNVIIRKCKLNSFHYQNVNGYDRTLDGTQKILIEQNIFKNYAFIMMYQGSGFLQENFLVQHNNFLGDVKVMNYYNNFTFIYNSFDYKKIEFGCNKLTSLYSGNYDYSNNYWGTTDTNLIKSVLKDKNDDLTLPYEINYLPILQEPTGLTPRIE